LPAVSNSTMRGDKSFADDLIVHRGVVSGRVALLLRSAETNPLMPRFVPFRNLLPLGVQASARASAVEVEPWKRTNSQQ
jgi:hypothetical protein